jgi:hypothetical protein
MNAGRDVERLISHWLVEEAPARSPDRILESTRQVVHRTRQRRYAATWREPMYISPVRLAGMAAVLVAAVLGGAWIGRATAPAGAGGPATPSASAAAGVTIEDYKAARDGICASFTAQIEPFKSKLKRIYDPTLPAADRAIEVQALTDLVGLSEAMTQQLAGLTPPAAVAADHAVDVSNYEQVNGLIRAEFPLIAQGKYDAAQALDLATDPLSADVQSFERRYGLNACP